MAACIVCKKPVLNPVQLPNGGLCHPECRRIGLRAIRLAIALKYAARHSEVKPV